MRLEDATILIVDDEPDLREIFSAWLECERCTVLTASNGMEALSILETTKVDVLLSDIRMPVMDGVELVREVFKRKLEVPSIIFVSGFGVVHLREMYGLGVEAMIEKPLTRKYLVQVLHDTLKEREELWLIPSARPVEEVELAMGSLAETEATCQFQMGKGGCCFTSDRPLTEATTIGLSIEFAGDGRKLKAQGAVRWFDDATSQAGVSFLYLDSSCRDWVIAGMRKWAYRSFIPECRCDTSDVSSGDAAQLAAADSIPS